jgi:hypothetical protein
MTQWHRSRGLRDSQRKRVLVTGPSTPRGRLSSRAIEQPGVAHSLRLSGRELRVAGVERVVHVVVDRTVPAGRTLPPMTPACVGRTLAGSEGCPGALNEGSAVGSALIASTVFGESVACVAKRSIKRLPTPSWRLSSSRGRRRWRAGLGRGDLVACRPVAPTAQLGSGASMRWSSAPSRTRECAALSPRRGRREVCARRLRVGRRIRTRRRGSRRDGSGTRSPADRAARRWPPSSVR